MDLVKRAHELALIRLDEVLKIIPVSKTAWYKGIGAGRYPEGVQLSDRTTAWRAGDIVMLLENLSKRNESGEPIFNKRAA